MKFLRELLGASLVVSLLFASAFMAAEPRLASAVEDQVVIDQVVTEGISISSPSDVTMTALSITQLSSAASTTWTVISNSQDGWTVTVNASSTSGCAAEDGQPGALCDVVTNEAFSDLATSTRGTWSVSSAYAFGFSAVGTDVSGWGTDAQSNCADGENVPSSTLSWQGFDGVNTSYEIGSSSSETSQAGSSVTLCLATEQDTVWAPSGTYYATTTATAVNN